MLPHWLQLELPVAKRLEQMGHQVSFLSIDNYYGRDCGSLAENEGLEVDYLPAPFCRGRYLDEYYLRSLFHIEFTQEIERYFASTEIDCVVLTNDRESLDPIAVRAAERNGILSVQLQHGSRSGPSLASSTKEHEILPGDSGFDLECVWSSTVASELNERGVGGKVVPTGNPRHDFYKQHEEKNEPSNEVRVLVAAQNFARASNHSASEEFSYYALILHELLSREEVVVDFKLHPQQGMDEAYEALANGFGKRLQLYREGDIAELLVRADALVTISSSVAIESLMLKLPTARLSFLLEKKQEKVEVGYLQFVRSLRGNAFPQSLECNVEHLQVQAEAMREFLDGGSAERTAEAIVECLNERTAPLKEENPVASVAVLVGKDDTVDSLYSLLRSTEHRFELLVIDATNGQNRLLEEFRTLADPRVRSVVFKGDSRIDAFKQASVEAKADALFWLESSCIAFPRWLELSLQQLEQKPTARVVLSGALQRDAVNIPRSIRGLDPEMSLQRILQLPQQEEYFFGFGCRSAVVKDEATRLIVGEAEQEQIGPSVVRQLVADTADESKVATLGCALIGSPFHVATALGNALLAESVSIRNPALSTRVAHEGRRASLTYYVDASDKGAVQRFSRFAQQVLDQQMPDDIELLILNSGAHHGVRDLSQKLLERLAGQYSQTPEPVPLVQARTALVNLAKGEFFIALDGKGVPQSRLAEAHLDVLENSGQPLTVSLGPLVPETEPRSVFDYAFIKREFRTNYDEETDLAFDHFWPGNFAVRRDWLLQYVAVLQTPSRTIWGQETRLAYVLWREGFRFYVTPEASATAAFPPSVEAYLDELSQRAEDFGCTIDLYPETVPFYFSASKVDRDQIRRWENRLREEGQTVPNLVMDIIALGKEPCEGSEASTVTSFLQQLERFDSLIRLRALLQMLKSRLSSS